VIRVCAIRSVACAGRRQRRWWQRRWRLTHLAAAVVDILARTDQQGRTHTHTHIHIHVTSSRYRRRESGCENPRSGRCRREESIAERGSRAVSRQRVAESPFDSLLKEGVASSCASTTATILDGSCRRARLAIPGVERGRKRGGKLALIEAGDSSHAHPGDSGNCKRSTAVKEKETKTERREERSKGRGG